MFIRVTELHKKVTETGIKIIPAVFIETVLLRKDLGRTLYIILILLPASILVCVLFAPLSPLTVSFEIILCLL